MNIKLWLVAAALCAPSPASADQKPEPSEEAGQPLAALTVSPGQLRPVTSEPQLDAEAILRGLQPLAEDELGELRAGETIVAGNQILAALNSGNTLSGGYSAGDVSIGGGSFSHFNGVGNVAINTGAFVNLQSAVNLVVNVSN